MSALELIDVHKRFGERVALDGLSFAVARGEVFGLLGPNGAGKTTIIRLALDILRPDAGEVRLLGVPVREADHDRVAYLPEERGLYRREKLVDVLSYLARLKGVPSREARARSLAWLAKVGLAEVAQKRVDQLSKGMSQKAQIAAALVSDPELAILDEPFSGLDPVHVSHVLELIRERREAGKTTILSTHLMDRVELVCDRVVLLHHGRLVRYGTVDAIRGERREIRVAARGPIPRLEGIAEVIEADGHARLRLDDAPAAVLRRLVDAGVEVERWEPVRASLEDVFVEVVKAGRPPSA